MYFAYTEAAEQALRNLRSTANFQWFLIPLLAFCFYVYFVEVERKNWNVIMAGLAFWGLEWFLEICNALWLRGSHHAAVWLAPGRSAYLIMVGLTIEISMMFLVAGVILAKSLPADKKMKIRGIPNRWVLIVAYSLLFVFIEVILHFWGVLVWTYWWWNWPFVLLIILIGYMPYMIFSFWIHDMPSLKKKIVIVSGVYALDIVLLVVFMGILKWI